jgi:hypothetical protein
MNVGPSNGGSSRRRKPAPAERAFVLHSRPPSALVAHRASGGEAGADGPLRSATPKAHSGEMGARRLGFARAADGSLLFTAALPTLPHGRPDQGGLRCPGGWGTTGPHVCRIKAGRSRLPGSASPITHRSWRCSLSDERSGVDQTQSVRVLTTPKARCRRGAAAGCGVVAWWPVGSSGDLGNILREV